MHRKAKWLEYAAATFLIFTIGGYVALVLAASNG